MKCFVLMPFSDDFTFVYRYGIQESLRELESETKISVDYLRADEILTLQTEKLPEILRQVEESDFVVIDITGHNPNVLWELGFCRAMGKHIVVLSQKTDNLPFNIRGLDIQRYDFSVEGMERLKHELVRKLRNSIHEIRQERQTLRFDAEVAGLTKAVQDKLGTISKESLLQNLARNEIKRLYGRIKELRNGTFELRNEKPNSEIIEYFCDYIKQLDAPSCTYHTVTNPRFWREITDHGEQLNFWFANLHAVGLGATIKRVFILDKRRFPDECVAGDELLSMVLGRHYHDRLEGGACVEAKVHFSVNYESDISTYENFGLLIKGAERLLFRPQYTQDDRMSKTVFEYCNLADLRGRNTGLIKSRVAEFETKFNLIWDAGRPLRPSHFSAEKPPRR